MLGQFLSTPQENIEPNKRAFIALVLALTAMSGCDKEMDDAVAEILKTDGYAEHAPDACHQMQQCIEERRRPCTREEAFGKDGLEPFRAMCAKQLQHSKEPMAVHRCTRQITNDDRLCAVRDKKINRRRK